MLKNEKTYRSVSVIFEGVIFDAARIVPWHFAWMIVASISSHLCTVYKAKYDSECNDEREICKPKKIRKRFSIIEFR